jgi:peptide/nickel transport system permease protein
MGGIILRRLGGALPILLIVSLITFGMIHLIPGDPAVAIAGLSATQEQVNNIRHDLGLDQPLLTQLWRDDFAESGIYHRRAGHGDDPRA